MKNCRTSCCVVFVLWVVLSIGLLALSIYVSRGPLPDLSPFMKVAGNMHPLLLHIPIGIFVYVVLAEVINMILARMKSDRRVSGLRFALGLGALLAFKAAYAGLLLFMQGGYEGVWIQIHMWWGIAFAISSGGVFMLILRCGDTSLTYRVSLFISAGLMAVAGHFGGMITHGDPFSPLRMETDALSTIESADELLFFEDAVTAVFDKHCFDCHVSGIRAAAGLKLDGHALVMEGGGRGPAVVAGSLDDSLISSFIHLPEDNALHMPPQGNMQLTDEEMALIDEWIAGGALEEQLLSDAGLPAGLYQWVLAYLGAEGDSSGMGAEVEAVDPELAARVDQLEQELGLCISRHGPQGGALVFDAVNLRARFDDAAVHKLLPLMPDIVELNLSNTAITSEGLERLLENAPRLERLNVSNTAIDGKWLQRTAKRLPRLTSLNLFGTPVSSDAVDPLSNMTMLENLYVGQTQLSREDIERIQTSLPNASVISGL